MKNILMLTIADIRKSKSQSISLIIFIIIAAMFMNVGLVLFTEAGAFFDERAKANNAAHFTGVYQRGAEAIEQGLSFMEKYPKVTDIEKLNALGGNGDYAGFVILTPFDEAQKMDNVSLIGESLALNGDAIYIPYFMLLTGDFSLGDELMLGLSGTELSFTIAGATEEIMFGAQMNTVYRFYVSDEKFKSLDEQFPNSRLTLLSAQLESIDDNAIFKADYDKAVSKEGIIFGLLYDDAKLARTMIPSIAAIIITVFSLILLLVSLIVIRFRIINSIEEGMANIGALKAIGYRSIQIISGIMMQFGLFALAGSLIGISLSQAVIPIVNTLIEPLFALVWQPGFKIGLAFLILIFLVFAVSLITYMTARKINKLDPLVALRGGIKTHSFKRNPLPLDKAFGGLNYLFAMKQLLRNKKQAFAISLIVAALSMASVVGLAVSYNMTHYEDFVGSFFGEMPDFSFMLKDEADGEAFLETLKKYPEIRKAYGYQHSEILIDDISIAASVVEDASLFEGNSLVSGRYPKHNNEIALGASILKATDKKVGDTVTAKLGMNEKELLITGIVQFMNQGGFNGIISGDALAQIKPDFEFIGFNAYIHEDVDLKEFLAMLRENEGDIFDSIIEMEEQMKAIFDSMTGVFEMVSIGIVIVTVFVVILTLYMVIKTMILRNKRELGIQKAVGFTTLQLMNQIALNMTPIILIGVVIGAFAGYYGLNPIMVAMISGMGIVKSELPVPLGQTVLVCIIFVAIAYAAAMMIAWRIRKISAYSLVSE
ncbi:MAG: FtsX-like permease family protein [Lachnospiraceae bacterium]|nr:FtsX-like permease family protein [Lachnospiraceae bacterium]